MIVNYVVSLLMLLQARVDDSAPFDELHLLPDEQTWADLCILQTDLQLKMVRTVSH